MKTRVEEPVAASAAAPGDEAGTFGFALGTLLWVEALVAVIAALTPGQPTAVRGTLGGYAALLAVAAVWRSGPLPGARAVSWGALVAVVALHALGWLTPLGPQPPRVAELGLYGVAIAGWVVLGLRERRGPPPPEPLEHRALGAVDTAARALGLLFLGGLALLLVDAVVALPWSGH